MAETEVKRTQVRENHSWEVGGGAGFRQAWVPGLAQRHTRLRPPSCCLLAWASRFGGLAPQAGKLSIPLVSIPLLLTPLASIPLVSILLLTDESKFSLSPSDVRSFACVVCFLTDTHKFTSAVCVVGVTAVLRHQAQAEVMQGSLGVPSGHSLQGCGEQG